MPIARGLFLEDQVMLQSLAASSDPPTEPEQAARLLRRWMHLRLVDKPRAHCRYTEDAVGFLMWLLRDTGDKPYQLLKQQHPEEAVEIRRQILVLCFWRANTCFRVSGLGLAMAAAATHAEQCVNFPEFALGTEDARF